LPLRGKRRRLAGHLRRLQRVDDHILGDGTVDVSAALADMPRLPLIEACSERGLAAGGYWERGTTEDELREELGGWCEALRALPATLPAKEAGAPDAVLDVHRVRVAMMGLASADTARWDRKSGSPRGVAGVREES